MKNVHKILVVETYSSEICNSHGGEDVFWVVMPCSPVNGYPEDGDERMLTTFGLHDCTADKTQNTTGGNLILLHAKR